MHSAAAHCTTADYKEEIDLFLNEDVKFIECRVFFMFQIRMLNMHEPGDFGIRSAIIYRKHSML